VTAAGLDIGITSNGSSNIVVTACGGTIAYEISGVLSDTQNEGLAGFALDLAFTGGPLAAANVPTSAPMLNFDRPAGLTGPAGFGGEVVDGRLVRVGGGQNTIKNTIDHAPFPIGSVVTGVAHTQTVLVTGSLTTPAQPGTYTLSVSNVKAIVIRQGEDGAGIVWATEPTSAGAITALTIIVPSAPEATAANDGPVCAGQAVALLGGPSGMASYSWTGPEGFTSSQLNPVVAPAVRGTYVLTVTDASNCVSTARTTVSLVPDPCESVVDCNSNTVHDACDIAVGSSADCNGNSVPDECDIAAGTSPDVNNNGIPDECAANLVAAEPPTQGTLWRTARNLVRVTFDKDIAAPASGQVLIQELLDGGTYGSDLSAAFTFTVANDEGGHPRVLRIQENGTVLSPQRWYSVRSLGAWASANNFEVQYRVVVGDVDGDGAVSEADVALVQQALGTQNGDPGFNIRADIDGDDRVTFVDLGLVRLNMVTNGDLDYDGDVDLADYAAFQACLTGPVGGLVGPECGPVDFDRNGDIDLADFAVFQAVFVIAP